MQVSVVDEHGFPSQAKSSQRLLFTTRIQTNTFDFFLQAIFGVISNIYLPCVQLLLPKHLIHCVSPAFPHFSHVILYFCCFLMFIDQRINR